MSARTLFLGKQPFQFENYNGNIWIDGPTEVESKKGTELDG
jgi:hypothetical protein